MKINYHLLHVAVWVLTFSSLFSQTSAELPFHPDVKTGQLDNGLRYFIQQNTKPEERVEIRLAIKAGSLQEEEDQLGLAHFVEHMAFNGTTHFEKNELIDYLESTGMRFGADLNAYTSFEETVYILQSRTDSLEYLEKAFLILEDWASGLQFDPMEIDKERGVVLSEWRSRLSPAQRLQQKYLPVLYKDSRYAERLPIGDTAVIKNATPDLMRSFYRDWYRPELMSVIVVGDIEVEWVEEQILKHFSTLKNPVSPKEKEQYSIPSHTDTRFAILSDEEMAFTEIELIIKQDQLKVQDQNTLRQQITHSLYNRMLNSRMQEIQRLPNPPFTFAYSGYGGDLGDIDTYRISAFVREGAALDGLGAVLQATRQAQLYGFKESELKRHKEQMLSTLEQAYEERDKISSSVWANRILSHFLSDGPLLSPAQELALHKALLPSIQLSDVNGLPNQWLKATDRTFVVTGPKKEPSTLPTEEALIALVDSINATNLSAFRDVVVEAPLMDTVLEAVSIVAENQIPDLGITEWVLENGLKVVLKPTDFQNDEILMSAFSPGGHSLYPDSMFRSADIAAFLVSQSGIGPYGFLEQEKALAGKRVRVSPYISEWYEGFSGSAEVKELETMLQLTYLYFTDPKKDSVLFESYIKRQESIVQNMYSNPYYHFADLKNKLKYGRHPRKETIKMTEVEKIELEESFAIYQDRFADASDFTFFFVGNFEPDTIQALICAYLGNLPDMDRSENWKNTQSSLLPGRIDTVEYRGQAPKSLVEIIYHGDLDEESDNRLVFNAMCSILNKRLRDQLREEKGGVYNIAVRPSASRVPENEYRVTLSFNCQPEETFSLIQIIDQEVKKMMADTVSQEEINTVKEKSRQSRIVNLKENSFWISQLVGRYKYELPLENIFLEKLEGQLNEVNQPAILQAAKKFLSKENYIELILMPEDFKRDNGGR
jgi:zinc protease